MALHMVASLPAASPKCSFNRLQTTRCFSSVGSFKNVFSESRVQCVAVTKISYETVTRRSANYQPSIWGYDYVQSLRSRYVGESYVKRIKNLKVDVSFMLHEDVDVDSLHKLELVDALERLGVSYHFEEEIGRILNGIYHKNGCKSCDDKQKQESLYAVALEFRLLRQHGYDIAAAETFSCFMDEKGKFKSYLGDDCKGILALYEAAYLSVDGESDILHEAINFTTKYLKEYIENNNDVYHSTLVNHALELPLHWRMPRLEARWFIDVYERAPDMNPILLELAKLDFNIVQATHQEDLKHVSSWWRKTGLGETLDFARDRIVENFFWTVGEIFEPQFGYCRRMSTKINSLITVIDDVYDVHGTIDELELFTDAVERWDVSAIDQLPYYMKMCFHVLHNSINDMAFDALKEQRVHVIPYLKKAWADMCKCFLLEAKWYNSGYIPTFQEYMDNAWISVSGPVILLHAYTFLANTATEEDFQILGEHPNIIRWSSTIFRLTNDLATSSDELKRGDVSTSIQCYMHETGACEREARERIRDLIAETWMKMNKIIIGKPRWSHNFIKFAMNLARIAQCTYQNGDGHTIQDKSKDRVLSLLIYPIALI